MRRRSAKRLAQCLAPALPQRALQPAIIYLQILRGLGSGSGWDMRGEVRSDATAVQGIHAPVIVDGGANRGQWATAMNDHLNNDAATYYLIEPQAACQPELDALDLPGKHVIQTALGAEEGEAVLCGSWPGFKAGSLYHRHETYFSATSAHTEAVRVSTLDDILDSLSVESVDLLKLDVEGSELDALNGAERSLKAGKIHAIGFEFGSGNIYSRTFFRDFWDLLAPQGFRFSRVLPGGRLVPVPAYTEDLEHFRGVSNYLTRLHW
jgi:FkbM family methyltransferase